jgi:hypothetical protein
MISNIEISNINKHILKYENKTKNKNKNIEMYSTIIKYDFSSINEINISNIIKNIDNYYTNYLIIENYDFVNISQLNETTIEKFQLINDIKYLIIKYNKNELIDLNTFLFNLYNAKFFIFHIIDSFIYILKSLIKLNSNNICYFNLSPENIKFNIDYGEKPMLSNFHSSLQISKLSVEYITNIIKKINNYTYKPLEIHILFYFIENNIFTISYSFIEEITEVFIQNLTILNLFSENFKETYKKYCIDFLKKYINKSKTDIITDILKYNDKWDVYSLSIIYLHYIGNILKLFSLDEDFFRKIINELSKNINPDPSKRNSLHNLLETYNELFNKVKDWDFVNKIQTNKLPKLFHI